MTTVIHFTPTGEPCDDDACSAAHAARPGVHPLDRDDAWMTRDGVLVALPDMAPSHRVNCYRLLTRNAPTVLHNYFSYLWDHPLAPRGDDAADGLEAIEYEAAADPVAWVESTPVAVALARLIVADGLADQVGIPDPTVCRRCDADVVERESEFACSSKASEWCGASVPGDQLRLLAPGAVRRVAW